MSFINNLNNADFLVMLLILVTMLRGYLRGFIKEFLSIFSIFFSAYISVFFYPNISLFIKKYIEMGLISDIISLSILFFFIYSCFSTVIKIITKKINNTSLEIFDKNFGIIFGFVKAMILLCIINILLVITIWKKNYPSWLIESKSLNLIRYGSNIILKIVPLNTMNQLKEIFDIVRELKDIFVGTEKDMEGFKDLLLLSTIPLKIMLSILKAIGPENMKY